MTIRDGRRVLHDLGSRPADCASSPVGQGWMNFPAGLRPRDATEGRTYGVNTQQPALNPARVRSVS